MAGVALRARNNSAGGHRTQLQHVNCILAAASAGFTATITIMAMSSRHNDASEPQRHCQLSIAVSLLRLLLLPLLPLA